MRTQLLILILITSVLVAACAVSTEISTPGSSTDPTTDACHISAEACQTLTVTPVFQQLRIVNSGEQDIKDLVVLFPGSTADAEAVRVLFGNVSAGETTQYQDAPGGVYRYAAYEYTIEDRIVNQAVVDWIGESPMRGEKFTYRIGLDPKKQPGTQIQLIEVLVDVP